MHIDVHIYLQQRGRSTAGSNTNCSSTDDPQQATASIDRADTTNRHSCSGCYSPSNLLQRPTHHPLCHQVLLHLLFWNSLFLIAFRFATVFFRHWPLLSCSECLWFRLAWGLRGRFFVGGCAFQLEVFIAWRFEVASNAFFPRCFKPSGYAASIGVENGYENYATQTLRTRAHNVLFYLLFGHCEWREEYIMHIDACDLFAFSTDVDSR